MQSLQLMVPSSPQIPSSVFSPSLLFHTRFGCTQSLLYTSFKSKDQMKTLACNPSFNEFSGEDLSKQTAESARRFYALDYEKETENMEKIDFSASLLPLKVELFELNLVGVRPEKQRQDWLERESIERRANGGTIPISLRIIKKRQNLEDGFIMNAEDFTYCSVKRAFRSMLFMLREIQNYALNTRDSNLYTEDSVGCVSRVQSDLNASFVWLFRQVFSKTPTLMVYVMILLANYTVQSISSESLIATTPLEIETQLLITDEENQEKSKPDSSSFKMLPVSDEGNDSKSKKVGLVESIVGIPEVSWDASKEYSVDEEMRLWKSIVDEAALRLQLESRHACIPREIKQQFVSPITVEVEPDDYDEYSRTDLVYQMGVAAEPYNSLILSNYAQFLYLVSGDHARAEECFRRAVQIEPPDAEALVQYADFLWRVKKELWKAEEIYQQAMDAEPNNPYHAAKYANFLWSTGGEETCFPLQLEC